MRNEEELTEVREGGSHRNDDVDHEQDDSAREQVTVSNPGAVSYTVAESEPLTVPVIMNGNECVVWWW